MKSKEWIEEAIKKPEAQEPSSRRARLAEALLKTRKERRA